MKFFEDMTLEELRAELKKVQDRKIKDCTTRRLEVKLKNLIAQLPK
jgi:hypothetical protein